MKNVQQTEVFRGWLKYLRDKTAQGTIVRRVKRFAHGNPGNTRSVGGGVFELRLNFGPGDRVYFAQRPETLLLLLCGGDKSTQQADIERAKRIAKEVGATYDFKVD